MILANINKGLREKITKQAEVFGIKTSQALDIISLTKNAIKEELQAEINRGQYQSVLGFLQNNAVRMGKNLLFDKLIQRVAARLIVKLGLPGGLAVTIATYLVPVVLKSISQKVIKNSKVQNFISGLNWPVSIPDLQEIKSKVTGQFKKPEVN